MGSRSPCRYQNISTRIDEQIMIMQSTKKIFSAVGGGVGKTKELMRVNKTNRDVSPPTVKFTILFRTVSSDSLLFEPKIRVRKSSMLLVVSSGWSVSPSPAFSTHDQACSDLQKENSRAFGRNNTCKRKRMRICHTVSFNVIQGNFVMRSGHEVIRCGKQQRNHCVK